MATLPAIPVEEAGSIATSADWQAWSNACTFLLGSGAGTNPMFYLMASTTQTFSTSQAATNFSTTAAIFKDNDGGFSNATPGRYTIQTAGYWTVDWTVAAGTSASNVEAWCQVVTSAANPYNPSATVQFQFTNTAQTTLAAYATSGGLCPIYLFPADILSVQVITGASTTSGTNPFSHFSGELVSA